MHISNEQKQAANQADLVGYLESRGYEMVKEELSVIYTKGNRDIDEIEIKMVNGRLI